VLNLICTTDSINFEVESASEPRRSLTWKQVLQHVASTAATPQSTRNTGYLYMMNKCLCGCIINTATTACFTPALLAG
jgi:hypothetical protein